MRNKPTDADVRTLSDADLAAIAGVVARPKRRHREALALLNAVAASAREVIAGTPGSGAGSPLERLARNVVAIEDFLAAGGEHG